MHTCRFCWKFLGPPTMGLPLWIQHGAGKTDFLYCCSPLLILNGGHWYILFFFSFCFKFLLWSKQNCTKSTKILQKSSLQLRNRLCCLNYVCAGFLGTRSCSWQGAPLIYRCVVYLWTSCLFFSIFLVSSSVAFLPVMETC